MSRKLQLLPLTSAIVNNCFVNVAMEWPFNDLFLSTWKRLSPNHADGVIGAKASLLAKLTSKERGSAERAVGLAFAAIGPRRNWPPVRDEADVGI